MADDWRPSKQQHYWERIEYWEESWRLEETCCHSNSSEKPSANTDVRDSKGVNNNNDNNGETWLGQQGDSLGNVQEISIRPYKQIIYAQPGTCPRKWLA